MFENHIVAADHYPQRISDRRKGYNSRQIRDEWNSIGVLVRKGLYHIIYVVHQATWTSAAHQG